MEERVWHKHYASQASPHIEYEETTLPEFFDNTVKQFPGNTALELMGKKISYTELDDAVSRLANAYQKLGIKKGDRIAIVLPNIPQVVIAAYAAWKVGAVVVMTNPLYTERELIHQLNDSGSKMAVIMDVLVPRFNSIRADTGLELIIAGAIRDYFPFPLKQLFPFIKKEMNRKILPSDNVYDMKKLLSETSPDYTPDYATFDEPSTLLYTGGTTGVSKGVMHHQSSLSINVQQMDNLLFDLENGKEIVIGVLPIFHSAGFTAGMNYCIRKGFNQVLIPRPDPEELLKAVLKYRPAVFGGVPTLYVGMLNHPKLPPRSELSFIRGCIAGAAPLALETINEWNEKVGAQIIEVYGMTEMSPVSHANPWHGVCKAGSVGIPYPDTDQKIVDVETGLKEMPVGEPGEIAVKGPQMMVGYYNRPDANADSIRDGWFYTGDIGYIDEEGYLFISDRKKDMIIAGGYNIYPREIDEVLFEHPKIMEACAIGIPDKYRGETVKAFVVVTAGATMTEEEVISYCKEKLAAYKVPKIVEFIQELPKSAIGKIMRKDLREQELAKANP